MTKEKLQNLASCAIGAVEKVRILKLWNSFKAQRLVNMFPIGPFNDSVFNSYLHRYVFWAQLRKAAMQPSVYFSSYIENNRIRNWDYAFIDLIDSKVFQKSFYWNKQIHGTQACRRLIYRLDFIIIALISKSPE
jgi:hypothetical protein